MSSPGSLEHRSEKQELNRAEGSKQAAGQSSGGSERLIAVAFDKEISKETRK